MKAFMPPAIERVCGATLTFFLSPLFSSNAYMRTLFFDLRAVAIPHLYTHLRSQCEYLSCIFFFRPILSAASAFSFRMLFCARLVQSSVVSFLTDLVSFQSFNIPLCVTHFLSSLRTYSAAKKTPYFAPNHIAALRLLSHPHLLTSPRHKILLFSHYSDGLFTFSFHQCIWALAQSVAKAVPRILGAFT